MPTKNRHTIVVPKEFWDDMVKAAATAGAKRGKAMSTSEGLRRAALNQINRDRAADQPVRLLP